MDSYTGTPCDKKIPSLTPSYYKDNESSKLGERAAYGVEFGCIIKGLEKSDNETKPEDKAKCRETLLKRVADQIKWANQAYGLDPADGECLNKEVYQNFIDECKKAGVEYKAPPLKETKKK